MFTASFLFASLIWSTIGFGYLIYGKKQGLWVPMTGGIAMIVISYVGGTALIMSLLNLGLMAAVFVLLRQGY
jgi:hypothetical protein